MDNNWHAPDLIIQAFSYVENGRLKLLLKDRYKLLILYEGMN